MSECPHKILTKQLVGDKHWYICKQCRQKFLETPWDGKVKVVAHQEGQS